MRAVMKKFRGRGGGEGRRVLRAPLDPPLSIKQLLARACVEVHVCFSVNSIIRIEETMYLYLEKENDCVTATSQIYAHRKRPSVFIQEYRIHNPSVGNIMRCSKETVKNVSDMLRVAMLVKFCQRTTWVAGSVFENNTAVHFVKFAANTSNSGLGTDCGIGLGWIRNKN